MLALGACSGSGGITLPTNLPTTISTSITLPTLPTQTQTQTQTQTETRTETRTETQTQTVTATGTPTTVTVTSTATATAAPQPEPTSSGLPAWAWVVLVILLLALIGLIAWLIQRTRVRAAWDARLAATRQTAGWVEDSLVPQTMSKATAEEAAATWRSAGPRLLAVDQELHDLTTNAPDVERGDAAQQLRGRLSAVVAAVSADTSTTAEMGADEMRARRATIQSARTELRNYLGATSTHR